MRILIVRHGEPDYAHDTLTEKGWREAELLSERLCKEKIDDFYVSPLGRAKDTASLTLKKMNREAVVLDWLEEFTPKIKRPDAKLHRTVAWDWLPGDWTVDERFYDKDHWFENPVFQEAHVKEAYDAVIAGFDELLKEYGYERNGHVYHTEQGNHKTICLFCHFGLETVLLSHIMDVSPMPLWHGLCALPTSVTTIYTEERRKGIASLRVTSFGDLTHLLGNGEEPSFAARYAECFEDADGY